VHQAKDNGVKLAQVEADRLTRLVGRAAKHQAWSPASNRWRSRIRSTRCWKNIKGPPLLVILDGVTDPHNLGAIMRSPMPSACTPSSAPKDNAVGINATVEKVASGAAETVPYIMVTNLARTIEDLKEHNIWVIAADMDGDKPLSGIDAKTGIAWVLGAEGAGIRRLVKQSCDQVARIPIGGTVESLTSRCRQRCACMRRCGSAASKPLPVNGKQWSELTRVFRRNDFLQIEKNMATENRIGPIQYLDKM